VFVNKRKDVINSRYLIESHDEFWQQINLSKSLISWCPVRIRKNITFLSQLFSYKLSPVTSSGIEITVILSYIVCRWKNSCALEHPLLFRRNPHAEDLRGISRVDAKHSCMFFWHSMSPFKTTLSLRDSMYYYTFIAELIINVSIQHVDFKHWVRTHDMAGKKY